MTKKLLSIMLAVMLVFACFVCTASAVDWSTPTRTVTFGEGGKQTGAAVGQYLGALGGKKEGDECWGYHFENGIAEGGYEYEISTTDAAAWVFNIYADGDATARILTQGTAWHLFFEWKPNGDLMVGNTNVANLERGKWHRIMLWFCRTVGYGAGKAVVIADDVKYTNNGEGFYDQASSGSANQGNLRFYVDSCESGKKGTVAFADCVVYEGLSADAATDNFYNLSQRNKEDLVQSYKGDNLVIDALTKVIKYNSVNYRTPGTLAAAIIATGNAKTADIFADSTLQTLAETIDTENNVAVLTSPNGRGYDYYKLEELPLTDMMKAAITVNDSLKNRIKKSDTGLYVYSGNYETVLADGNKRKADSISSDELIAAISSENGYALSYIDEDKADAKTDSVTGGFIKAEKENSDTIYLPIMPRTEAKELEFPADFSVGGDGADPTSAENVAGKQGTVYGVAYNNTQGNDKRYVHNPADWYTTYTYTFNMYADGDAAGFIGFAGGNGLLIYNADGTLSYYDDGWKTADVSLERGRWHKIAVTYDSERCRFVFFANGKLIIPDGRWMQNGADMHFGSDKGKNGRVLLDDFVTYEGYYEPSNDIIPDAKNTGVKIDNAKKMIYYKDIATVTELENAVRELSGASAAKLYADDSFAGSADALDNDKNVMVLTTAGNAMGYYGIADMPQAISDITFGQDSDKMNAYISINDCDENVILYIASYKDGKLTDVNSVTVAAGTNPGTVTAQVGYSAEYTYKAFLWNSAMLPIRFAQ